MTIKPKTLNQLLAAVNKQQTKVWKLEQQLKNAREEQTRREREHAAAYTAQAEKTNAATRSAAR